ncbi:MAG TPA: hypothetical protein VII69_00145 [Candidatus Eremiobacteraceae bacterium]
MISLVAAAVIGTAIAAKPKRKHRVPPPRELSIAAERIERRRVVRLAIIAALIRRETELEDFIAAASTESPLLAVREPTMTGPLAIGPTIVDVDFLGSPIIRSIVRNRSSTQFSGVLVAHLAYGDGRESTASVAVSNIGAGESRRVELLCPAALRPTALHWAIEKF